MIRYGEDTTDSEKIAAILVHITYLREEYTSLKNIVTSHITTEDGKLAKMERRVTWMPIGFLATILAVVVAIVSMTK